MPVVEHRAGERSEQIIDLFKGGFEGFGDAINIGRDAYHWNFNINCLAAGRAVPSFAPTNILFHVTAPITSAFEWHTSDATPPVSPMILYSTGLADTTSRVARIMNNTIITDEDQASTKRYTHGVLYRHDGTNADAEAAFFCRGSGAAGSPIRRLLQSGVYAQDTAKADRLVVVGPDLWRVIDGYKMEKLVADQSPLSELNWGPTRYVVGSPAYDINQAVELGGSPWALKGDGVFKFNPASGVFENQTPFIVPHVDNGKGGTVDGRGRIYYPTVSAGVLVLGFGSQQQERPTRFSSFDRDTPYGRISVFAADEEYIYAAVEPGTVRANVTAATPNGLGMVVKKDINGIFTPYTTQATDQSYATEVDISDIDKTPTANEWLYVGADEPFWGIYGQISAARTNTIVLGITVEYSTATGFSDAGSLDSTSVFFQDGAIVIDPATDIVADGSWVTRVVDGDTKYWLRFQPTAGTFAGAKLSHLYLIPYRPAPDPNLFAVDIGRAIAGALPKILVGQWRGERLIWQDVWTLATPRIEQLVVSRTAGANSTGIRNLWAIHKQGATYVSVGPEAHPARASWPLTSGTHAQMLSGTDFGLPVNTKSVQKIVFYGEHLQSDDEFRVCYRWDGDDRWHRSDRHSKLPVVLEDLEGRGRVLYVYWALNDAARDAVAPHVWSGQVTDWTDHGSIAEALGSDIRSPQTV